jgi:hypothetical protein
MSSIDINKLRELVRAATPGPWRVQSDSDYDEYRNVFVSWPYRLLADAAPIANFAEENTSFEDAEFIAAANPTAVLALLDRLARAEALLADAVIFLRHAATAQRDDDNRVERVGVIDPDEYDEEADRIAAHLNGGAK